jgi:hypothetical protein
MIAPELTKYQAALVMELVCPLCRYDLFEIGNRTHCFHCNAHFISEESPC